jgi:hypothetical protein
MLCEQSKHRVFGCVTSREIFAYVCRSRGKSPAGMPPNAFALLGQKHEGTARAAAVKKPAKQVVVAPAAKNGNGGRRRKPRIKVAAAAAAFLEEESLPPWLRPITPPPSSPSAPTKTIDPLPEPAAAQDTEPQARKSVLFALGGATISNSEGKQSKRHWPSLLKVGGEASYIP